jgi:hypothetical protein
MDVSIIIPVLNKLEFTRQCLDRIWRNTRDQISADTSRPGSVFQKSITT